MLNLTPTKNRSGKCTRWWTPLWRGLIVPGGARHYETMRSAIWLFGYLLLHADRSTGRLIRKLGTIAADMEIKPRTIRYWLSVLRKHRYISTKPTGTALQIVIHKWKPLKRTSAQSARAGAGLAFTPKRTMFKQYQEQSSLWARP